jgi:hypothetical protein
MGLLGIIFEMVWFGPGLPAWNQLKKVLELMRPSCHSSLLRLRSNNNVLHKINLM